MQTSQKEAITDYLKVSKAQIKFLGQRMEKEYVRYFAEEDA